MPRRPSQDPDSTRAHGASAFVGRGRELAILRRAFAGAVAGHGTLVVILGEPGIGKTRLADQLAREGEADGALVLVGRSHAGGGAPAYWPWVTLLRRLAALGGEERARAWLGAGAAAIAAIAPDVVPADPAAPDLAGEAARFRLFDAVATTLERAAAERPLLILLDDVHAADSASLQLLAFAVRQLGRSRVLFVATGRAVEMRTGVAATIREELAGAAEYLELGGLSEADVGDVVGGLLGAAPPAGLAAKLHDATGGNPFFVEAIVRALPDAAATTPDVRLPDGVRDAIRTRLRPLAPPTRELLALAALLGREIPPSVLAEVAGVDLATATAALDEAEHHGLVGPPLPGGRRRFAHALIVETLTADVPALERARLHQRIATVLAPRIASGAATLDQVATHYFEAVPAGAVDDAIDYAERAARGATARLGYEDAVGYYRRALAVLDASASAAGTRRLDLLLALGDAERRIGDTAAAQATYRRAATLAAEAQLPAAQARAALGYGAGLGGFWDQGVGSVDRERVAMVRAALDALDPAPSGLRALLLAQLSAALFWASTPEESALVPRLGHEAMAMAAATAGPSEELAVLAAAHWTTWGPADPAGRLRRADDIVRRAGELEQPETMLRGRMYVAAHHLELGDAATADQEIARFAALATTWGLARQRWYVHVHRGMRAHLAGRFDDVEAAAADGLALGAAAQPLGAPYAFEAQRVLVRREQGRAAETLGLLRDISTALPGMPAWGAAYAAALVETGDTTAARRELDRLMSDDLAAVPRNFFWLYVVTHLSRVAAGLDDRRHAATLYDLLLPFADQVALAQHGILCDGAVARYLGLLATTLERFDAAERHFARARELNDRIGARIFVTATQVDEAAMLRMRGRKEDAPRVATLLAAAADEARGLGQTALLDRIAALGPPPAGMPSAVAVADACTLRRTTGDWSIAHAGRTFLVKDMIGVTYLVTLLRHPGQEIHALELVGGGEPRAASDAGELLDERARDDYRRRLAELGSDLEEAQGFNDVGRAERAQVEIDRLGEELARAVGLGGRARRAGSAADRARLNVTRAVRRVIEVIAAEDAALGSDLERGVRTGTFCSYTPDPRLPVRWEL